MAEGARGSTALDSPLPCWKGEGDCSIDSRVDSRAPPPCPRRASDSALCAQVSDLVVEGNLTVQPYHDTYPDVSARPPAPSPAPAPTPAPASRRGGAAAEGTRGRRAQARIPPIIHFIFGMAPDFGGVPP